MLHDLNIACDLRKLNFSFHLQLKTLRSNMLVISSGLTVKKKGLSLDPACSLPLSVLNNLTLDAISDFTKQLWSCSGFLSHDLGEGLFITEKLTCCLTDFEF